MEKSVFYLAIKIRSQKNVVTKNQVNDFVGTFVVNLRGVKAEKHFIKNYL